MSYDFSNQEHLEEAVASNMSRVWEQAKQLADLTKAEFFTFLQPSSATGKYGKTIGRSFFSSLRGKFMNGTYKVVRETNNSKNYFYDLTDIMNGNERIFYDHCHTASKGNRIIAKRMCDSIIARINSLDENQHYPEIAD